MIRGGIGVLMVMCLASGLHAGGSAFQIGVSIAGGYTSNDSMNNAVNDYGADYASRINKAVRDYYGPGTRLDDYTSDNRSGNVYYGGDAELRFFSDTVGFGIAAGYYQTSESSSTVESTSWPWWLWGDNAYVSLILRVTPVVGTLYYRHEIYEDSFISIGAGAGYYGAEVEFEKRVRSSWLQERVDAKKKYYSGAAGYHAKIEYAIHPYKHVMLTVGVLGRYVMFDRFKNSTEEFRDLSYAHVRASLSGVELRLGAGVSM